MIKVFTVSVKIIISLMLSSSVLAGIIALVGFFDPSFSIGLFDMLRQGSFFTWLLLFLATAIIYAILSRLPVGGEPCAPCEPNGS